MQRLDRAAGGGSVADFDDDRISVDLLGGARQALAADPLDESAWRALLQSMEAGGQHADGLRTYDHCRRLHLAAPLGA